MLEVIKAQSVILATGGYGRTYARTTNALINTGDGMALALREGVPLADMECVQFHPTTLFGTNILVSEAVRGEGGYLFNNQGERFMERYVPGKMELAPRDIVSRCIQLEIKEGRGFQDEYVHLDVSHFGPKKIEEKIPQVKELAQRFAGVDISREPMPVQPAQHYSMGGIRTNIWGETNIAGLFAAGECACVSIHGANRLGGNSLMETIVFGRRAGLKAREYALQSPDRSLPTSLIKTRIASTKEIWGREGKENLYGLKETLGKTMTEKVGVFRHGPEMQAALETIKELQERYKAINIHDRGKVYNTDLLAAIELGYLLELAETIASGALLRKESRGAHDRSDYPQRDDTNFLKHILAYKTRDGIRQELQGVSITRYYPETRGY